MRHVTQWLVVIGVVTGGVAGTTSSSAQSTVRDHRHPAAPPPAAPPPAAPPPADHVRDHRREPPPAAGPTDAPPPLREENTAPRAGFVFVRGRWDWRGGKWEWLPGHWERERAGKQWREARWEQRDGAFVLVDGEWIDIGAAAAPPPLPTEPPPPEPGAPDRREHRRVWRLDRPMVSSYWPLKGKVGSRIVIHGRNSQTTRSCCGAACR
jgi:hypothetical protein